MTTTTATSPYICIVSPAFDPLNRRRQGSRVIVTISQPRYLPFQGYFTRIDRSDRFILLDNVQYARHDWENRNKVKTAQGPSWLTVPVNAKFGVPIPEVRVDNTAPWQTRH